MKYKYDDISSEELKAQLETLQDLQDDGMKEYDDILLEELEKAGVVFYKMEEAEAYVLEDKLYEEDKETDFDMLYRKSLDQAIDTEKAIKAELKMRKQLQGVCCGK